MIKPPRTAILAAVVATTVACKGRTAGPGPDHPVGTVAHPEPAPKPDTAPEGEPPDVHDVGTVAAPQGPVGTVARPPDDKKRHRAPPPPTDPSAD